MIAHSFRIDGDELSRAKFLIGMVKNDSYSPLCNTQQLTQPPLALRLQSTLRVGGGSAFCVRRHSQHEAQWTFYFLPMPIDYFVDGWLHYVSP